MCMFTYKIIQLNHGVEFVEKQQDDLLMISSFSILHDIVKIRAVVCSEAWYQCRCKLLGKHLIISHLQADTICEYVNCTVTTDYRKLILA